MYNDLGKTQPEQEAFIAKIAGIAYRIKPLYISTYNFFADYLSSGDPDINVTITEEDIEHEIEKETVFYHICIEYIGGTQDQRVFSKEINKSCIETVVLHRKLIEASIDYGAIFIHGAVIATKDKTFMFTAQSGTGKTTHILKWTKKLPGAFIVNGDKPLIKITDSKVIACGTPWCGNEDLGTNTMVPLTAIVLMERSSENHMEKITFGEAYPFLLQQTYIPHDSEKAKKTLNLLSKLGGKVEFFKFYFDNFQEDCFDVAYNALVGDEK